MHKDAFCVLVSVGGSVKRWLKSVTDGPFPLLTNQNHIGGKWIV